MRMCVKVSGVSETEITTLDYSFIYCQDRAGVK